MLLLPLIAFATATSGTWLRCRLTGANLSACCCAGDDAEQSATPTVAEADCCDRVVRGVAPAPVELSAAPHPDGSAPRALATVLPSAAPAAGDVAAPLAVRAERRAVLDPPTVRHRLVSKSAFLI